MQVTHVLFQDRQCGEVNLARGGQGSGDKLQPGKEQRNVRAQTQVDLQIGQEYTGSQG